MARQKTAINTDLSAANTNRRQKTDMHGTSKSTGRGAISKLKKEVVLGEAVELMVSVEDCRLFPYNDRIYDGLNMENCKSLVDDIQKNTQLQAVVARKDPTGEKGYEIIFGTRRFWACQHTIAKTIKIAVIEADDKQAYKIMRSENDERDNTTAYEKASNAKRVIAEIFDGSQKNYCLENDIAEATLSGWMAITDLDQEVVACIPSMYEISANQASKLRTVMNKKAKAKKAVLDAAIEIKGSDLGTSAVMKKLIAAGEGAAKPKTIGPTEKVYSIAGDEKGVVVKKAGNGVLTIKVSKVAAGEKAAVIKALSSHLE